MQQDHGSVHKYRSSYWKEAYRQFLPFAWSVHLERNKNRAVFVKSETKNLIPKQVEIKSLNKPKTNLQYVRFILNQIHSLRFHQTLSLIKTQHHQLPIQTILRLNSPFLLWLKNRLLLLVHAIHRQVNFSLINICLYHPDILMGLANPNLDLWWYLHRVSKWCVGVYNDIV